MTVNGSQTSNHLFEKVLGIWQEHAVKLKGREIARAHNFSVVHILSTVQY